MVFDIRRRPAFEAQIDLVDHSRRLQGMVRLFVGKVASGEASQLADDLADELMEGLVVASLPGLE
jgi:hypothetical protein